MCIGHAHKHLAVVLSRELRADRGLRCSSRGFIWVGGLTVRYFDWVLEFFIFLFDDGPPTGTLE